MTKTFSLFIKCTLLVCSFSVHACDIHSVLKYNIFKHLSPSLVNYQQRVNYYKYTLPLYRGSSSMYYYINMYIGANYQPQSYIIDTTSSITTSPCKPLCSHCGKHKYDYYEVQDVSSIIPCHSNVCSSLSSSCNNYNQCSFHSVFSEGSAISGVYVSKQVHFTSQRDNSSSTHIPIGCTSTESHSFYVQNENGIIGLSNSNTSFINVLYNKGMIKQNIFSLCVSNTGIGYISIGNIDNSYHKSHSKISYVPLYNPTDSFYTLEMKKLIFNKDLSISVGSSKKLVVIDSGSVVSYIPHLYFEQTVHLLTKVICASDNCGKYKLHDKLGICYTFNNSTHLLRSVQLHWPEITLVLAKNVQYTLKPTNYFHNITNNNKYEACFGLVSTNENVFTFGLNWMSGHDVIFDKGNKRVGFVEADCNRNNSSEEVNGDEETKWNEVLEIENDNEEKELSKEVVIEDTNDTIKEESNSIDEHKIDVQYAKIYVLISNCMFIIVLIMSYCLYSLIYRIVRNNMFRLKEEHESGIRNGKQENNIEGEVEIAVQ